MNALPFPTFATAMPSAENNPAVNLMTELGKTYSEALQSNFQQTWMSSARIIQEHAARVMTTFTQESMAAMAEIAAQGQQQSFSQLINANQQVAAKMTSVFAKAMTEGFKPAGTP
ncbi:hypothetical protein [Pseudoduganella umbonata]|uniref:Flagellar motor switch protein FliM n=1 Tax=Pseudoduganella umbonata TaxID=864828 RepID=A0A4P8HPK6_9BURK|nr:hypothetical protein [Pseudoduganella umbonata]MBB3221202.1 flagellar motor switch protein FliM [Pseudoduganella umbonata]QCP10390.1 hypothetical protein FCL38_08060 [Pseudoduganella umbonata]